MSARHEVASAMVFVAVWHIEGSDLVTLPTGSATYIDSCRKPLPKLLPAEVDRKKEILLQDLAPAHHFCFVMPLPVKECDC